MKMVTLVFREVDRDKFQALVDGRKSVETRAATPKYRQLMAGDAIVAKCGPDRHVLTILKSTRYDNVADLLKAYDYRRILPSARSAQDAIDMYAGFPGYAEKLKTHGIMAFEVSRTNKI